MKMPGRCTGPEFLSKSLGKWGRRHLGGHDLVRRMDRKGRRYQYGAEKCSGYAKQRMGTKEFGKMMKRIQTLEEGSGPSPRGKELENQKRKEKKFEKGVQEAVKQF